MFPHLQRKSDWMRPANSSDSYIARYERSVERAKRNAISRVSRGNVCLGFGLFSTREDMKQRCDRILEKLGGV